MMESGSGIGLMIMETGGVNGDVKGEPEKYTDVRLDSVTFASKY